ncbi:unnamed protein product [Cunninghamella blakesleeana]
MFQFLSTFNQYNGINRMINRQDMTSFYQSYFLKYTNTKLKRLTITMSIGLILIGYGLKKLLIPPKQLRHLKRVNFFKYLYYFVIKQTTLKDYHQSVNKKIVEESNGIYLQLDRYGWIVYVANPEAAKQVLIKGDLFPKIDFTKLATEEGSFFNNYVGFKNILMTNGDEWMKHRKLTNPAFKVSLPVRLFGEMTQNLFQMLDNDYKDESFDINIHDYNQRITLDIIGKAGFGFDFNSLADEHSPWKETFHTLDKAQSNPLFFMFPILENKLLFLFPKRQEEFKKLDEWKAMLSSVIENKRQLIQNKIDLGIEETEKDLLTLMIESEFRGEGILTNEELISDLTVFFIAGHDTTAFALSSAIYFMAAHPEIQEKARQEVINVLCPNGEPKEDVLPTIEDTKKLAYVNQIIKETMRINNSVIFLISPRVATEDVNLNGTFIPKNTQINVSIYDLHHNANVWEKPEEFNPDRFKHGGEADNQSGLAWVPFSSGSRQCIGMNFSLVEQRVILSCLLRKYEMSLPDNSIHKNGMVNKYDIIPRPVDLKIRFKRRY